ncbi:MAG: polysaccharide deacetylase [Phycisphaerales bacterium]|nr:MAG: polysaccharide deacetylase [Phycisphaerales bacterium]
MRPARSIVHAMSFDIEDWFHIVQVPGLEPEHWDALSARCTLVERYTDQILAMLDAAGVQASFFVLGWIADRYPDLVRRIRDAGHELATHGYLHERVDLLDRRALAEDLQRSIDAIERACGVRVQGYRAPSFSIRPGCEWAFDVLAEAGIRWDASLFPARRGHGGYPCRRGPHRLRSPAGAVLAELPMSVWSPGQGFVRIGYSGGGYLRLLPQRLLRRAMDSEAAAGRPTVVYLHPRDLAPDCPRVPMPLHRRWKCYVGLDTTRGKLERLLAEYTWAPCSRVLEGWLGGTMQDPSAPRLALNDSGTQGA